MVWAKLCVERTFSASEINAVVNHPDVRPFVGRPSEGDIDLASIVADKRNIVLMAEGGGLVLHWHEPGVYEVHTQFVPEVRGKKVLTATRDMQHYMFARTDCIDIQTKVPGHNPAATALTKRVGGTYRFHANGAAHYGLTIEDWGADALAHDQISAQFLTSLLCDAEPVRKRALGIAFEMMAFGQIGKGVAWYNRIARHAEFPLLNVIAENPLVFDLGEGLVALRNNEPEVILCR